jgi:hypothetical protein
MADLQLDPATNDILVTDDALAIVEDGDAIIQHLAIRLRFFLGEWFLDTRLGIPYFDSVLVKNPNLVLVRGILRNAILTTPGVLSLESFAFDFDNANRVMAVDFTVRRDDTGELLDFSKEFIIA